MRALVFGFNKARRAIDTVLHTFSRIQGSEIWDPENIPSGINFQYLTQIMLCASILPSEKSECLNTPIYVKVLNKRYKRNIRNTAINCYYDRRN